MLYRRSFRTINTPVTLNFTAHKVLWHHRMTLVSLCVWLKMAMLFQIYRLLWWSKCHPFSCMESFTYKWAKFKLSMKEQSWHIHRASFTNNLRQHKPSFGVIIVLSVFIKDAQWRISAVKVWTVIFCTWPYWICIFRSFPFRRKIYGRRVFKWITQRNLLTFALVKLLVFAPLFNQKSLKLFCKWLQLLFPGGGTAKNKERMVNGEDFSTCIHLFGMPEEHIIRTYRLSSHVIFNLLQEIKEGILHL